MNGCRRFIRILLVVFVSTLLNFDKHFKGFMSNFKKRLFSHKTTLDNYTTLTEINYS